MVGSLSNPRMTGERICSSGGMIIGKEKQKCSKKTMSQSLCLLKISLVLTWERTWVFGVKNYCGHCAAGAALRTSKYCFILDLSLISGTIFFNCSVFEISFKLSEPHRHNPFITKSG